MINSPALRENISLQIEHNEVAVVIESFVANVPCDGLIIKNRFTLAGTLPDSTLLNILPEFNKLLWHPGYASVGIVEEAGRGFNSFGKGDYLLMPAVFSKFVQLDGSFINDYSQYMFIRLPAHIEPLQALFIFLTSLAIYLVGELELDQVENICLLGCGLLGLVILRIMQLENKQAVVYRKGNDVDERLIAMTDSKQIDNFQEFANRAGAKRIMVLSDDPEYREVLSGRTDFEVIDACRLEKETVLAKRPVWLSKDFINEAVGLINNETDFFNELIYQHVHIEFIDEILKAINKNQYRGRVLIYDW